MERPERPDDRKAALLLHSLSQPDQHRVIERLALQHQQRLRGMLEELQSLGIPKGRAWVPAEDPLPSDDLPTQLKRVPPDMALRALADQSTDTVATLLMISSWPWAAQVLAPWPADKRHRLEGLLAQRREVPSGLARHLMARMLAAVEALPPQPRQAAKVRAASWFSRWLPFNVS